MSNLIKEFYYIPLDEKFISINFYITLLMKNRRQTKVLRIYFWICQITKTTIKEGRKDGSK